MYRNNKIKNYDPGGNINELEEQKMNEDKFYRFRSKNNNTKYKYNTYKKSAYILALVSTFNFIKIGGIKLENGIYFIKKDYNGDPDRETCALIGIPIKCIKDLIDYNSNFLNNIKTCEELKYINGIEDITIKYCKCAIEKFLPYLEQYDSNQLLILNIEPRGETQKTNYLYPVPRITIPGGKMEAKDSYNFELCGLREFKEETGIDITDCHEKISREKINNGKKIYKRKNKKSKVNVIFENMYYLVKIK